MLAGNNNITKDFKWKEIEYELLTIIIGDYVQYDLQRREAKRRQSKEIAKNIQEGQVRVNLHHKI